MALDEIQHNIIIIIQVRFTELEPSSDMIELVKRTPFRSMILQANLVQTVLYRVLTDSRPVNIQALSKCPLEPLKD